jgi:uncharacterized protein YggE
VERAVPPDLATVTLRFSITDETTAAAGERVALGQVIDLALARGVTEISGIRFSTSETEQAYLEALQEATQKARARAEAIALASGGRIGRVLQLSTEPFQTGLPYALAEAQARVEVSETVIVEPSVYVPVVVYGRWEFLTE